jgi:hypothetical protein
VGTKALDRFGEAGSSSSDARSQAYDYQREHIADTAFIGNGFGASFGLADEDGLSSSLENGYAMFVYDFGLLGTAALVGIQVAAVLRRRSSRLPGVRFAGVLACAFCAGFSSFATNSAAGVLLWSVIALNSAGVVHPRRSVARPPSGQVSSEGIAR